MSGSRDTRESTEEVGTSGVPTDAVPPSFGGADSPADPPPADAQPESAEEAESATSGPTPGQIRLPPFTLQAPWWAAESTETGPPEEDEPSLIAGDASSTDDAGDQDDEEAGTGEKTADTASGESSTPAQSDTVPLGTLVAGIGVPAVDSRGAVPAEPIVKRPLMSGDTDPDGFPAVRPGDDRPEGAAEAEKAPAAEKTPDAEKTAAERTAADTAEGAGSTAESAKADEDGAAGTKADTTQADATETDATEADATRADITAVDATKADPSEADTVVDMPAVKDTGGDHPVGGERDPAFERAKAAEDASSASSAPVLEPDAILPVGVTPPTGSGPFPHTGEAGDAAPTAPQAAVAAPVPHGVPPQRGPGGGRAKRRLMLVGGGAAAILAAAVALFVVGGGDGGGERSGHAKAVESPAGTPSPSPSASASPSEPASSGRPSRIDHEKTDPQPLAFEDVFPTTTITLGGRTYTRDRWSLNRDPSYAARGSMLETLLREKCRKIIRATFIDRSSSLAVTSGIVVMPTKEAAVKVSRAGDPANYEWFRGMGSKHTPNLDRAGGYAAATVRGRYVAYAYVQWANGKPARPGDPVIKQAAQRFLDYDLRPIMERARG